ncbi:MAG TPA: HEAT repeat domain-containing protein [Pyrinomonadaceae bacterium]|jgi:HEAT repeat protein|nr:HEAT repeat domain-containing protein [Pyrinomonadaceae bacterium]
MPNFGFHIKKLTRRAFVVLLFAATGLGSSIALHAQHAWEDSVRLVSILTRQTDDVTTVTLSADTPLTHTQMWKDDEGFHIVLPDAGQSRVVEIPRGVQVRHVGISLEILVQTQPHAEVGVQPLFNRLTLLVSGGLDTARRETFDQSPIQAPCKPELYGARFNELLPCGKRELLELMSPATVETSSASPPSQKAGTASTPVNTASSAPATLSTTRPTEASANGSLASTSGSVFSNMSLAEQEAAQRNRTPLAATQGSASDIKLPTNLPTVAYDNESDLPQSKLQVKKAESGGFFSAIISPVGIVAFLGPGMLLVLLFRQRFSTRTQVTEVWKDATPTSLDSGINKAKANGQGLSQGSSGGGRHPTTLETPALASGMHPLELTLDGLKLDPSLSSATPLPGSIFEAERIKQEVGLLIKGLPYSLEVLSSRATDDRKVFEVSLVQKLNAPDLNEEERERARRALEENGFVLRRGALLLSATDAAERALAARTLAEMSSPTSIPFLLEAINDPEAMVRTEAIGSIGVLKEPSAIGPLLDAARRYPDMSISLLRDVLCACSFESVGRFNTATAQFSGVPNGDNNLAEQVRQPAQVSEMEDVPESLDDETLAQALGRLEDEDVLVRVAAARTLGQFRARCSLTALTSIALLDLEPGVRAAAATSLGNLNHESVFAHLLIAHSDESREVQAAAARSLSRLNIDRGEAFVRLLDCGDEQTLRDVMRACIKTGMVSQAVGKLASRDRRQAYEAFSLLSLLEKLKETHVLQVAIERCQDGNARSAARTMFGLSAPAPTVPVLNAPVPMAL